MDMREREQHRQQPASPSQDAGNPGELEQVRQQGRQYLDVARDAIARALSGNSLAFLAANRQQGGQ